MSEHTPEPWACRLFEHSKGDDYHIYAVNNMKSIVFFDGSGKEKEANARRIVACVNNCEGISTETLEKGSTLSDILRMQKGAYDKLRAENAKLREALKELMSIVKIHSRNTDDNFAWAEMSEARAALGKDNQ